MESLNPMTPLGIIAALNIMLTLIGALETVASKFIGTGEMWEMIKKFLALIRAFRDWIQQRKDEEQKRVTQEQEQAKQEVQQAYEDAKKKLEEAGYSDAAFDDALNELRKQQQSV